MNIVLVVHKDNATNRSKYSALIERPDQILCDVLCLSPRILTVVSDISDIQFSVASWKMNLKLFSIVFCSLFSLAFSFICPRYVISDRDWRFSKVVFSVTECSLTPTTASATGTVPTSSPSTSAVVWTLSSMTCTWSVTILTMWTVETDLCQEALSQPLLPLLWKLQPPPPQPLLPLPLLLPPLLLPQRLLLFQLQQQQMGSVQSSLIVRPAPSPSTRWRGSSTRTARSSARSSAGLSRPASTSPGTTAAATCWTAARTSPLVTVVWGIEPTSQLLTPADSKSFFSVARSTLTWSPVMWAATLFDPVSVSSCYPDIKKFC